MLRAAPRQRPDVASGAASAARCCERSRVSGPMMMYFKSLQRQSRSKVDSRRAEPRERSDNEVVWNRAALLGQGPMSTGAVLGFSIQRLRLAAAGTSAIILYRPPTCLFVESPQCPNPSLRRLIGATFCDHPQPSAAAFSLTAAGYARVSGANAPPGRGVSRLRRAGTGTHQCDLEVETARPGGGAGRCLRCLGRPGRLL